ncbi:MAG: hypothetical protein FD152_4214 [Xanthobacteraceae bacterium]|nr:MAG: hypothetical protein FD152_4214 [Xanthobacteraceae bacterium]
MLREKTVFVVGAGASREFGLPMGAELIDHICQILKFRSGYNNFEGDPEAYQAVRSLSERGEELNAVLQACRAIEQGAPLFMSIDHFVNTHEKDRFIVDVAKVAIGYAILRAEAQSKLMVDYRNVTNLLNVRKIDDTWITRLVRMISSGLKLDALADIFSRSSFICFNYDRCIEHFLWNAVRVMYRLSEPDANSLMSTLQIVHPYGVIGHLPWQTRDGGIYFGQTEHVNHKNIASRIRTFTEQNKDKSLTLQIDQMMNDNDRVVFLGFGYYEQNMEIIKADFAYKEAMGTTYGMSSHDVAIVKEVITDALGKREQIGKGYEPKITLASATCTDFFDQFTRTLAKV